MADGWAGAAAVSASGEPPPEPAGISGKIVDLRTGEVLHTKLPEPRETTIDQVRTVVIPLARTLRERIRERRDLSGARELARRLEAFRRYLTDREGRNLVAAETRRTELLIGQLLPPADEEVGGRARKASHASDGFGKDERYRFRLLADHADAVEEALGAGVVSRKALLERIQYQPGAPVPLAEGFCTTLVADPPWRYGNTATRANADGHYDGTLSIAQLCGEELLPDGTNLVTDVIKPKAATPGHLYLWTTAGHLPEAFDVMTAWGYTYKTYLVWVKKTADGRAQMGMGNYFRISTELVLFGIRGGLRTMDRGLLNWFEAQRRQHSAKPLAFRDLVKKASPGPYLELFGRCAVGAGTQVPGTCECSRCLDDWEIWGNQT
jgi:N6-adenosine-specific RNA methylase IME4